MQERERRSLTLKIFKTPGYGSIWVLQYFVSHWQMVALLSHFLWSSRCCRLIFVFLVLQNNSVPFTLNPALQLSPWSKLPGWHFSLFVSLSVIWPPSIHSFSVQFSPPIPNNNMCFSTLQKHCIKNAAFLLYCCRPGRGCAGRVQPVLQETVLCGSVLSGRRWCGTAQTEDHTAAQTEGMSFKMYRRNVTAKIHDTSASYKPYLSNFSPNLNQ